jgi:hypothetical protein
MIETAATWAVVDEGPQSWQKHKPNASGEARQNAMRADGFFRIFRLLGQTRKGNCGLVRGKFHGEKMGGISAHSFASAYQPISPA